MKFCSLLALLNYQHHSEHNSLFSAWTYVTNQFNLLTEKEMTKDNIMRKYENMMKKERVNVEKYFFTTILFLRISKLKILRKQSGVKILRISGIYSFEIFFEGKGWTLHFDLSFGLETSHHLV